MGAHLPPFHTLDPLSCSVVLENLSGWGRYEQVTMETERSEPLKHQGNAPEEQESRSCRDAPSLAETPAFGVSLRPNEGKLRPHHCTNSNKQHPKLWES